MFLADTSVWVDYFRGANSPEAGRLDAAFSGAEDVCLCGLVLTEILQGITEEARYRRVRQLLANLTYLAMSRETYLRAAEIFRAARKAGRPLRNSIGCLIAACAVAHGVPVLTKDKDFQTIANLTELELARAWGRQRRRRPVSGSGSR